MEELLAEQLVAELSRHPGIIPPDKPMFLTMLVSANIPASSRFYEELPDTSQLREYTQKYHYLSLRRVLRNRNAKECQLNTWKKTYEMLASTLGLYSSDVLSRNVRTDKMLIDMMAAAKHPFSVLGKLETYDYDNPTETLLRMTRPVLVIPEAENIGAIVQWEIAQTTYEVEVGLFLRCFKQVSQRRYERVQYARP